MSLQDCIQEALQHNLDVQIERYNPQISLYNLNADYGGYDPTFNLSGQHDYNDSGADVSKRLCAFPAQEINDDSFSSSFNGSTAVGHDLRFGRQCFEHQGRSICDH